MSFLSISLNSGAAAARNTPPSSPSFSYRVTLCPRRARRRAASMPPIPPPTTATFFAFSAGFSSSSFSRKVTGFRAQRPICPVMPQERPLYRVTGKQPLWQAMQGRMSSRSPARTLSHQSGSHRSCRATPTPSTLPLATASAAISGSFMRPAQITGMVTNCFR